MKFGIVFKPAFRQQYGYKQEFDGYKIELEKVLSVLRITCLRGTHAEVKEIALKVIQLTYFSLKD